MSAAKGQKESGRRVLEGVPPSRHDDRIRPLQESESPFWANLDRRGGAQCPPLQRAHREFVPGNPQLRSGKAEHLDRDRELEQRDPVVCEDDDAMPGPCGSALEVPAVTAHGHILANNVISA